MSWLALSYSTGNAFSPINIFRFFSATTPASIISAEEKTPKSLSEGIAKENNSEPSHLIFTLAFSNFTFLVKQRNERKENIGNG